METDAATLGVVDYIICVLMLLISAGIGVYFRFSGTRQKTTDEYLLASKNMSILPVAFSLMATYLSAVTIIGIPSEMYRFGIHLAYINIGFVIGITLSAYIYLPVFFNLQDSSVYEYLNRRFGQLTRTICSVAFILQTVLITSVVLYAPTLALSAVTNIPIWISTITIGLVCTFYSTLGGMRAILWIDLFQAILMFLGTFAVIIKGCIDIGDIRTVVEVAYKGGRILVPGIELDYETRYTLWNIILYSTILSMSYYGGNQVQVQRLLTLPSVEMSKSAMFLSIPIIVSCSLLCCFSGVVMYSYFADCDPLTSPNAPISAPDQLLPFFMMTILSKYPGLAGLCISGIFSASATTVSSSLNALCAVTVKDIVRPLSRDGGLSEKKMAFRAKIITLFYGILCVLLTFLVAAIGNLIQACFTFVGIIGAPILSVFFLGMMTQRANQKGVIVGLVVSILFTGWVSFGGRAFAPPPTVLPVSVKGCGSSIIFNATHSTHAFKSSHKWREKPIHDSSRNRTDIHFQIDPYEDVSPLYRISYLWSGTIGFSVCVIIGYLASILFDCVTGKTQHVDEDLLSPVLKFWLKKKIKFAKSNR